MNKLAVIVVSLSFALLSSMMVTAFAAPPIQRPMGFIEETIEGGSPATVDYSIAYDTASGELIQNMMDTLVVFNGEHTDQFLPAIATSWSATPLGPGGTGIDSGLPISGLSFESANQTGHNATYYYRYDFKSRQGVFFQPPWNYSLTGDDVVFSFQRTMIMDAAGGPQWMIQEPLLDVGALDGTEGGLADLTNMTQVAEVGALIQNAVQSNGTDVWFNLMFPGAYAPFMQILTQTWSSIESKQWIDSQVIGAAGRTSEWDGGWPTYTSWLTYHNPSYGPLDAPTPMMYGSGPYIITTLDYTNMCWSGTRHVNYFRGWPANFPALTATSPAGWADTVYVTWAYTWSSRLADFKSGAADFVAVPTQNLADMFKSPTPPYSGSNYPIDGVRDVQPLPVLDVDAYLFTFNINATTPYALVGTTNTFNNSLIPSDFFGNANWGIKVRQAFAQAFDYNSYIANVSGYNGEVSHPATAIVPGLTYYDPSVTGYSYNLAAANESLNLVGPDSNGKMLKDVGFTLTLVTIYSSSMRQLIAPQLLKSAIESLNPLYHVNIVEVHWSDLILAAVAHKLPMFLIGWLADFPDASDLALPFYRTGGAFAAWQAYSNPAMDALVDAGINTPDGQARAQIYHNIQALAVQDCPSFTLDQPISRRFERDWVVGWYYNPAYPGQYFYNMWKWYYSPQAQDSSTPSGALSEDNTADVNYDGKIDMKDIAVAAASFGAAYGPPVSLRWVYRADINNDRKVDMKDIAFIASYFGETSAKWTPS